ncbi:MAG: hypothetical protein JWP87_5341 [Labilithrix sp.]|nr:hypothetical protein [Labilithrix sp.]
MSVRRATTVAVLAIAVCIAHVLLVRAMAHGHVAHVLLGSGNTRPPIGAALLAISLVVVRVVAVVIAPGALLASLVSFVAHVLVGPPRSGGQREGAVSGTGTSSGTGTKPEGKGSGGGAGLSMEGRGTQ